MFVKNNQSNIVPLKTMRWLLSLVTIFLLFISLLFVSLLIYPKIYRYRFFPGVRINNQPLADMSVSVAAELLQKKVDDFLPTGISLNYQGQLYNIPLIIRSETDPDVVRQILRYDAPHTVSQAYAIGRSNNWLINLQEQLQALIFGFNVNPVYEFNRQDFYDQLRNSLEMLTAPKIDARPLFDSELNLSIVQEKPGRNFDYQAILNEITAHINTLDKSSMVISLIDEVPQIKAGEITPEIMDKLNNLAGVPEITLFYQNKKWPVVNKIFLNWLVFNKSDGQLGLIFDASSTGAYLTKNIGPEIYRPTLEGKFNVSNGRVTEFQGSQDGQELNLEATLEKLAEEFINQSRSSIELVVNKTSAKVTTASVNDLGITEIIGTGQSNFARSPKNRRHNIATGANSLNGLLIAPGQEFSLIAALGKIDAAAGYKPELVIKGDQTIPEYGGGLCQIGTTVFRSALAAGLPITERHPHSYRVVYYEPAGKDATIYDPRPDLRFINDTAHNILIQSRIEGDNLYFDFWGAKDGRTAYQSDSVVYNITGPGPTRYVPTAALKAGEEKCVEVAHNGADAYFDYQVTYSNGEVKETRFSSHYIPWPAKCLVGKEPESAVPTTTAPVLNNPN